MPKNCTHLLLMPLYIFLCIISAAIIYQKEIKKLRSQIEEIFLSTLSIDMNNRLNELNVPYHMYTKVGKEKNEDIVIRYEDKTSVIPRTQAIVDLSIEEKQTIAIQTFLYHANPINVVALDSLFLEQINRKNIQAKTAISYTDNKTLTTNRSLSDSSFFLKAYTTDKVLLGMGGVMTLQGFYKISASIVFRRIQKRVISWCFINLLISGCLSVCFILFKKKQNQSIQVISLTEIKKESAESTFIKMSDTILFCPEKNSIFYDNAHKTIQLTEILSQLMQSMLETPDHFISNEMMEKQLRGTIIDSKNWRGQTIKRLREALIPIPEITILNERGKGYKLLIQPAPPSGNTGP